MMQQAGDAAETLPFSDEQQQATGSRQVKLPPRAGAAPPRRRLPVTSPSVPWYGKLLIIAMLLVAAGWEIFRLLLWIVTLD